MQAELSKTVVVLDLDDTLYKEADYQNSGLMEVCAWVDEFCGKTISLNIDEIKIKNKADFFEEIARLAGLPLSVKESLLWIYRLHTPSIVLDDEVKSFIGNLEFSCKAVVILTDGRSVSQRKKLKALGLIHLPAYISEEYGSEKPDVLRFKKIMIDFPGDSYLYVGDNPKKDFLAPNSLGWKTFGLLGDERNIHPQVCDGLPFENLPQEWIKTLKELLDFLC